MRLRLVILLTVLCCGACASAPQRSVYDDLGGQAGIEQLVEDLLVRVSDDPRIAPLFIGVDIVNLHSRLSEHLCAEAGGPCVYAGKNMVDAHAHVDINAAHFNALVENLVETMEARGVPRSAQNRLLARLAPMQRDVVGASRAGGR
ncbi:group 1 truncated hemoglobin [Luteimonas aestuarii]|uniref:Group 1 truncated hemoglobin n=1 Tax=Luteimonas aestuarii TaxID=453837 RepID=A0A4R5U3Z5_9GAMM|nr:group 1 truncated hemoglobin [Luteimonas aestuarii]TDK28440.1 group 1 truncated hemoglobin [Luteimonas aestuarii]